MGHSENLVRHLAHSCSGSLPPDGNSFMLERTCLNFVRLFLWVEDGERLSEFLRPDSCKMEWLQYDIEFELHINPKNI